MVIGQMFAPRIQQIPSWTLTIHTYPPIYIMQPMTDEETRVGALNRAKRAAEAYALAHEGKQASFAVGLVGS